eukprot:Phypoly_transcript_15243.p1 GENE.Phypoly_transcript_15243~~Phypoly_transcript_15243.p1  ORF type:complete len:280 (+),score=1.86 Phypoly_transcript_15243:68-907(+)
MIYVQCASCKDNTPKKALERVCCAKCISEHVEVDSEGEGNLIGTCYACSQENVTLLPLYKCSGCRMPCKSLKMCRVCDEWVEEGNFTSPGICGHAFCNGCWSEHIAIQISEGNIFFCPSSNYCTVRCMGTSCATGFSDPHIIKSIVTSEKYSEFKEKAAELVVKLHLDGSWCPNPECGAVCIPNTNDLNIICLNCNMEYCKSCSTPWHRDRSCSENLANMGATSDLLQRTTKQCPQCKSRIEKNGGCNHMTCKCGAHWCWLCLTPWPGNCEERHWFGNG